MNYLVNYMDLGKRVDWAWLENLDENSLTFPHALGISERIDQSSVCFTLSRQIRAQRRWRTSLLAESPRAEAGLNIPIGPWQIMIKI